MSWLISLVFSETIQPLAQQKRMKLKLKSDFSSTLITKSIFWVMFILLSWPWRGAHQNGIDTGKAVVLLPLPSLLTLRLAWSGQTNAAGAADHWQVQRIAGFPLLQPSSAGSAAPGGSQLHPVIWSCGPLLSSLFSEDGSWSAGKVKIRWWVFPPKKS